MLDFHTNPLTKGDVIERVGIFETVYDRVFNCFEKHHGAEIAKNCPGLMYKATTDIIYSTLPEYDN